VVVDICERTDRQTYRHPLIAILHTLAKELSHIHYRHYIVLSVLTVDKTQGHIVQTDIGKVDVKRVDIHSILNQLENEEIKDEV